MACPHFLSDGNECALLDNAPADEEEGSESSVEDSVNRELCLGAGDGYRRCPIFRDFLSELLH